MKLSYGQAFKTGLLLASIAGISALLLSGLNRLTAPKITQNRLEKEAKGLRVIFGENALYDEAVEVKESKAIEKYWPVTLENHESARVYSVSGTNSYGNVGLLVGVYGDFSLGTIYVLENTESYASTLQDEYIAKYIASEDKETAIDNVSCGATYGAKLVRSLILSAKEHFEGGNA